MRLVVLPGMDGSDVLRARFALATADFIPCSIVAYPATGAVGYSELEDIARSKLPTDEPFVLLGESFSGPIAISIAASNPGGMVGVVLCASFAQNPRPMMSVLRVLIGAVPLGIVPNGILSRLLLGPEPRSEHRAELVQAVSALSPEVIHARLRAVMSVNVSGQLASLALPLLYVRAVDDHVVPAVAARRVATVYSQAQVVEVPGPHSILQVNPSGVADAVREFVGGIQSAR